MHGTHSVLFTLMNKPKFYAYFPRMNREIMHPPKQRKQSVMRMLGKMNLPDSLISKISNAYNTVPPNCDIVWVMDGVNHAIIYNPKHQLITRFGSLAEMLT